MNNKKHIDRIFQEKLKNLEVVPDDSVWDNIHDTLHKNKRKSRVIPLWWYSVGVAALLLILFTIGNVFKHDALPDTPQNTVVDTETPKEKHEIHTTDLDKDTVHTKTESTTSIVHTEKGDTAVYSDNNTSKELITTKTESHGIEDDLNTLQNSRKETVAKHTPDKTQPIQHIKHQNPVVEDTLLKLNEPRTEIVKHDNEPALKHKETLQDPKELIDPNKTEETIENTIAQVVSTTEKTLKNQTNRWSISPHIAPVYFNSLGKGSSIDNQFINSGKSGDVNMSYGISGSYAINDKVKVRTGINKVNMGYNTNGVLSFEDIHSVNINTRPSQLQNINFKAQAGRDVYMSTPKTDVQSAAPQVVTSAKGALEQHFGYIEIPLEIEYSLVNSKFGLNAIGGFSTLFLNNNEIYSVLDNRRSFVGEANNMNRTSYSANFGLGFNYHLSSALKLNIEPMFKYQINSFTNTSGDFRPYFIGVYSGFSFKF